MKSSLRRFWVKIKKRLKINIHTPLIVIDLLLRAEWEKAIWGMEKNRKMDEKTEWIKHWIIYSLQISSLLMKNIAVFFYWTKKRKSTIEWNSIELIEFDCFVCTATKWESRNRCSKSKEFESNYYCSNIISIFVID